MEKALGESAAHCVQTARSSARCQCVIQSTSPGSVTVHSSAPPQGESVEYVCLQRTVFTLLLHLQDRTRRPRLPADSRWWLIQASLWVNTYHSPASTSSRSFSHIPDVRSLQLSQWIHRHWYILLCHFSKMAILYYCFFFLFKHLIKIKVLSQIIEYHIKKYIHI